MRQLTWLLLLLAAAPSASADDFNTITFQLRNNFLIVVTGSVGNVKDLAFILDTGARRSIVERTVAEKIGGVRQPELAFVAGGTLQTSRLEITELSVGPIFVPKLWVLVMDLTGISRMAGTRIDGVLGMDVLRSRSFTIDYRRKELHFGAVRGRCRTVPFDADSSWLVTVTAQVNGQPMRLLVDSGADQLTLFFDRLPADLLQSPMLPASGTGLGGDVKSAAFLRGAEVQVGDLHLRDPLVFVLPGEPDGSAYDGNLGVRALGATQVHFDFVNGNLCWQD